MNDLSLIKDVIYEPRFGFSKHGPEFHVYTIKKHERYPHVIVYELKNIVKINYMEEFIIDTKITKLEGALQNMSLDKRISFLKELEKSLKGVNKFSL